MHMYMYIRVAADMVSPKNATYVCVHGWLTFQSSQKAGLLSPAERCEVSVSLAQV